MTRGYVVFEISSINTGKWTREMNVLHTSFPVFFPTVKGKESREGLGSCRKDEVKIPKWDFSTPPSCLFFKLVARPIQPQVWIKKKGIK